MSSSFTSENPESDVSTDQLLLNALLELTPDIANARYDTPA